MKNNITEIVCILDRSGSMAGLEGDVIGGFNTTINDQKEKEGKAFISTILFSNHSEVLHDRLPIEEVEELGRGDYRVFGVTALYDAIGDAIRHISNVHKYIRPEDVPEKTVFVITTDGMENASRRYSYDDVQQLVRESRERCGWEFLFLGANMDAIGTARRFGISENRAVRYECDSAGTALNFKVVSETIGSFRKCATISDDWCAPIAQDYRERGKK